jgi:hypothetical protein
MQRLIMLRYEHCAFVIADSTNKKKSMTTPPDFSKPQWRVLVAMLKAIS